MHPVISFPMVCRPLGAEDWALGGRSQYFGRTVRGMVCSQWYPYSRVHSRRWELPSQKVGWVLRDRQVALAFRRAAKEHP